MIPARTAARMVRRYGPDATIELAGVRASLASFYLRRHSFDLAIGGRVRPVEYWLARREFWRAVLTAARRARPRVPA